MGALQSPSDAPQTPPLQTYLQQSRPIVSQTIHSTPGTSTSAPLPANAQGVKATTQGPPPYSVVALSSRQPTTATHINETEKGGPYGAGEYFLNNHPPASAADDVFRPNMFDQVFFRLKNDFTKLVADEAKLLKIREGCFSKARTLEAQRQLINAEKAHVAGLLIKAEREREVTAAQYAAAVELQEENVAKEAELMGLARKLKQCEKSLRDKEKSLREKEASLSSSSATGPHVRVLPPSIEQDTLPGLPSEFPAVATEGTPRMPSPEGHILRRRGTVVHRTSFRDLSLSGCSPCPETADSTQASMTGENPSKKIDETVDGA
jgi:hypothetical protein